MNVRCEMFPSKLAGMWRSIPANPADVAVLAVWNLGDGAVHLPVMYSGLFRVMFVAAEFYKNGCCTRLFV